MYRHTFFIEPTEIVGKSSARDAPAAAATQASSTQDHTPDWILFFALECCLCIMALWDCVEKT
jgi:hypothetical protein